MILWLLTIQGAWADVVDRVVAAVDDTPVTASEVALEVEVDALWPFQHPCAARDAPPLDRTIDRVVLRAMAGDTAIYQPAEDRVAAGLERLRAAFPDREALVAWETRNGLDDAELVLIVKRRLVVERWLERNVRGDAPDRCAAVLRDARARHLVRVVPDSP